MNHLLTSEELDNYNKENEQEIINQLDSAAQRTLKTIQKGKRIDRTHHRFLFFIHGPKPLEGEKEIKPLLNMFCKNNKDIKYAEIGSPEKSPTGVHQHCIVVLKENFRFQRVPKFTDSEGNIYTINFTNENAFTKKTGNITWYLKYIRKDSPNPSEAFFAINNGFFDEHGQQKGELAPKASYDHDIATSLEMTEMRDAINYMSERHPSKFLKDEQNFRKRWLGKHYDEIQKRNLLREDLEPFKEELKCIKDIRTWIGRSLADPKRRMGNLFIVGPSKMGKTEFVIQEIYLKHPCYLMKGDFDFTGYNEDEDYKFIIFDDVNYMRADNLERIRSLTSSIDNPVIINIKYGSRTVNSRPIIHLINDHQYQNIVWTIKRTHSTDWWGQNMTTVRVDEPLFERKKKVKSSDDTSSTNPSTPQLQELNLPVDQQPMSSAPNPIEDPFNKPATPVQSAQEVHSEEQQSQTRKTTFTGEVAHAREKMPKVSFIDRMSMKLANILPEELYNQVSEAVDAYLKEKEGDSTMEQEETDGESLLEDEFEEMHRTTRPNFDVEDEEKEERKRNAPGYAYNPSLKQFKEQTDQEVANKWGKQTGFNDDSDDVIYD